MSAQKKSIKIENLLLNLENPRFDHVKDQKEALDVMLMSMTEKIKKLAQDIVENGIDPGKLLRVSSAKQQNKYIVLDGNRRLTAIKLIKEPSMIKEDNNTQQFFQNLKQKMAQNVPETLSCLVFSSKEEANHWIELEHTGENKGAGQVSWNAEQKARFKAHITGSILKQHIQVQEFMQRQSISFPKHHSTTLQRLISNPQVREKIGIYFEEKKLKYENKQMVIDNLKKVSNAMQIPGFNVRKLDTVVDRKKWINRVLTDDPPPLNIKTKRKEKIIRERILITNRKTLIPKNCSINIDQDKVNLIYDELQKLDVDKYRNAVAVLFRVFLELSVTNFIKNKNLQEKSALPKTIQSIGNYMKNNNILNEDELKTVDKATSKSSRYIIFSTDTLNKYIHNLDYIPIPDDLKNSWNNLQKFIKKLWE